MSDGRFPGSGPRVVDSVLRALTLVEEAMDSDIGVSDMAEAACYSPFYFSRLFALATGHAPYDYLMRRRVAAAAEDIVSSDRSLTEIALNRGFEVSESFARAFRRCFGILPSEARKTGEYPRRIARTPLDRAYLVEMLEAPPAPPEALHSENRVIVGEYRDGSEGNLLVVERDGGLRPRTCFAGSSLFAEEHDPGEASIPDYPRGLTRLPAGPYLRFRVGGDQRRLSFILEFAYRSWLPASGTAASHAYDIVTRNETGFLSLELPLT